MLRVRRPDHEGVGVVVASYSVILLVASFNGVVKHHFRSLKRPVRWTPHLNGVATGKVVHSADSLIAGMRGAPILLPLRNITWVLGGIVNSLVLWRSDKGSEFAADGAHLVAPLLVGLGRDMDDSLSLWLQGVQVRTLVVES